MASVLPVDTRSTIASATPSRGATSTAPLMGTISTSMPRSANTRRVLRGWLVAMRRPGQVAQLAGRVIVGDRRLQATASVAQLEHDGQLHLRSRPAGWCR